MVDDSELRRRLQILKKKMEEGKIVIAEHLSEGFRESFGKVRYGSDGEIDLSTVDGRVRSTSMVVATRSSTSQVWPEPGSPVVPRRT